MRRLLTAGAAIAALLIAAPAAGAATTPKTETATQGAVAATLTYRAQTDGFGATGVTLAITRDGAPATVALGGDVASGCESCRDAMPLGGWDGSDQPSLTIADLQGDGELEVIVDLFTGGAHCCSISAIYGWDPATSSYQRLIQEWGDPGYTLKKLGPGPQTELVSNDARFAYAFCAYACSWMPTRIFQYTGPGQPLTDVTRQYPALIRSDIAELRKTIRSVSKVRDQRFGLKGLLAPLCADYYLLDQGARCRAALSDAKARGWFRQDDPPWRSGQAYINSVLRSLDRWGYR